ncbi:YfhH family protein [Salinicoccus roseus]|uniref:YfhH family protein n=1 Tax=Salinicoccus roseus TaxID=45670 RepID=UPI0029310346|nr:YfhH family protein [Salinicoccus roseus]
MMKPLNTMTRRELEAYIAEKREAMRKAEMMGVENEYRVLERQVLIAESYFIDLSLIEPGKIYKIISNEDHYFKVEYVKGIFAWGFFVGGEDRETGIPVSMLQLNKRG